MTASPSSPGTRTVIAIDVGGTKTLGLLVRIDVDEQGRGDATVLDREQTDSDARGPAAYDRIEQVVTTLRDRSAAPLDAIGVGMAGFIGRDGIARSAANTPGLIGVDVPGRLVATFGLPVIVDNDANCVAVAARAQLAPDVEHMVAITLGTGIGGGIVVDGDVLRGSHGFAGEPGHMVIDPSGPLCPCGQHGCWERFASGSGLGWLARRTAAAGDAPSFVQLAGSVDAIRGEHVTELLDRGDDAATAVFGEFAGYVALGVANLVVILDPELVVIGGGLASQGERLADAVQVALRSRFPSATGDRALEILVAPGGPDSGALGAAWLAAGIVGEV
ncbi:MAG: ROK family protein [Microthrixaceae bacterium]